MILSGVISLALAVLFAQSSFGVVQGTVTDCTDGPELFVYNAAVSAEGNDLVVKSGIDGNFVLPLPPGNYTIVARNYNGTAVRRYVPVDANETIDIGTLDIGGGITGCYGE